MSRHYAVPWMGTDKPKRKKVPQRANDWSRFYTYGLSVWSHKGIMGQRLWVEKRSGRDGISWDVLQQIKNDILGPESICVEVYPAQPNVVNEINRRHLWEVPEGFLPFSLIRR